MEILYPLVALGDNYCLVDMAVLGYYDCKLRQLSKETETYGYKCPDYYFKGDTVIVYLKRLKRLQTDIGPKTYKKLINIFLWKSLMCSLRYLALGHVTYSVINISKTLYLKLADALHYTRLRLSLALSMLILGRYNRAEYELSTILKKKHLAYYKEERVLEAVGYFLMAYLPTTNNNDRIKHLVGCCLKVGYHILHDKYFGNYRYLLSLSLERLSKCTFDRQNQVIKTALIGCSLVLSDKLLYNKNPVLLFLRANNDKVQYNWYPRFRLAKYPRLSSMLLGLLIKFEIRKPYKHLYKVENTIECPDDLFTDKKRIVLPPRIIKPARVEKMKYKTCTDVGRLIIKNKFLYCLLSDTGHKTEIQYAYQKLTLLQLRVEEEAQPLEKLQGKVGTFILKLKNYVIFSKASYKKKIRGWVMAIKFLTMMIAKHNKYHLQQKYLRKHCIYSYGMIALVNSDQPYLYQFPLSKPYKMDRIRIGVNGKQLQLLRLLPTSTLIRILNKPTLFSYNLLTVELRINLFLKRLRCRQKHSPRSYKKYSVYLEFGERSHTYDLLVCQDRYANTTTIERLDAECPNHHLDIRFIHKSFRIMEISVPILTQIVKNLISQYWYSNSLAMILHVQRVAKVTKWIKTLKTNNFFKSVILPGRYLVTQYKVENGSYTCFVYGLMKGGKMWQEYTTNKPYLHAYFFNKKVHGTSGFLSVYHVVRYLREYVYELIISKTIIKIRAKLNSRRFHREHRDYFWKKFYVIDYDFGRTHMLLFSIRPQGLRNYQAEVFSCSPGLKLHIKFYATRLYYGFLVYNCYRLGYMFELKGPSLVNRIHTWQKFTLPRLSAAVQVYGLQIYTVPSVASLQNRVYGSRRQSLGYGDLRSPKHTSWGPTEPPGRRNTILY